MNSKKSKSNKTNGGKSARIRGGRQILVVGLVALVLAAGYYRWTLGNIEESAVSVSTASVPESEPSAEASAIPSPSSDDTETFGSAGKDENKDENNEENKDENKDSNDESAQSNNRGSGVIMQSRQDRDRMRAEAMDKWKEISSNSNASESAKKEAEDNILKLTGYTEKENVIETNVKSKGFDDCFAQISDSGVSVIVKGGSLDSAVVAQIKDIIVTETGEPASRIKISAEE